mgnify:FL=1
MDTKKCLRCKQDLPFSAFSRNRGRQDGYHPYCKVCMAQKDQIRKQGAPKLTPLAVREFMEKVKIVDSGCWEWQGATTPTGYGRYAFYNQLYAHRFSFYIFKGDLCDGMEVCHTCDNPRCVNPAHLWQGTKRDNMRDCAAKGRINTVQLTPEQVRTIRQLHNLKYSTADLAQRYGVTTTTIWAVIKRRTWDYIADEDTKNDEA